MVRPAPGGAPDAGPTLAGLNPTGAGPDGIEDLGAQAPGGRRRPPRSWEPPHRRQDPGAGATRGPAPCARRGAARSRRSRSACRSACSGLPGLSGADRRLVVVAWPHPRGCGLPAAARRSVGELHASHSLAVVTSGGVPRRPASAVAGSAVGILAPFSGPERRAGLRQGGHAIARRWRIGRSVRRPSDQQRRLRPTGGGTREICTQIPIRKDRGFFIPAAPESGREGAR